MKKLALFSLFIFVVGCALQTDLVYKDKGDRQCYGDGQTIQKSSERLQAAGVKVIESTCGKKAGAVMAVSGGPSLNILIHTIDASDIAKAKTLGYRHLSQLSTDKESTAYQLVGCPSD